MQVKILLSVVLCLVIFAGYYLTRSAVQDPGSPKAIAPSGKVEIASQQKRDPNNMIARLQQRLAQAEQEQLRLAERVLKLETVIGKPGTFPNIETGAAEAETETNDEPEHSAP